MGSNGKRYNVTQTSFDSVDWEIEFLESDFEKEAKDILADLDLTVEV